MSLWMNLSRFSSTSNRCPALLTRVIQTCQNLLSDFNKILFVKTGYSFTVVDNKVKFICFIFNIINLSRSQFMVYQEFFSIRMDTFDLLDCFSAFPVQVKHFVTS